jgi:hypothetical protein
MWATLRHFVTPRDFESAGLRCVQGNLCMNEGSHSAIDRVWHPASIHTHPATLCMTAFLFVGPSDDQTTCAQGSSVTVMGALSLGRRREAGAVVHHHAGDPHLDSGC